MFQSQRGFTLIELVIAIALISILATIAVININYMIAKNNLNTASSQLVTDIRTMQQLSMEKSTDDTSSSVNITFGKNSYQIITDTTKGTGLPSRILPNAITLTSSRGSILGFNPNNFSSNPAAMITITSSALPKGENTRTLIISHDTGRIRIDTSSSPSYRSEEN